MVVILVVYVRGRDPGGVRGRGPGGVRGRAPCGVCGCAENSIGFGFFVCNSLVFGCASFGFVSTVRSMSGMSNTSMPEN